MNLGEHIYCIDESVYSDNISKRRRYEIIDIDENKYRIRGDKNKFVWIPKLCFTNSPIPELTSINIDDEIRDKFNDCIEVTINFSDDEHRYGIFTTINWIKNSLEHSNFFIADGYILLKELTGTNIENTIVELDKQNKLIDLTNSY